MKGGTVSVSSKGQEFLPHNMSRNMSRKKNSARAQQRHKTTIKLGPPTNTRSIASADSNRSRESNNKSKIIEPVIWGSLALLNLGAAGLSVLNLTQPITNSHTNHSATTSTNLIGDTAQLVGHTGVAAVFGSLAWSKARKLIQ